jgi:hypothetical protein
LVRGPAALLAFLGAALAYFLVAPSLPELAPRELSALLACAVGLVFVVGIVAGLAATADSRLALVPALIGAALVVAALDANGVAAAATPFEVALFGCVGLAFAVMLDSPALALALPLFLGAIDVLQAATGGSAGLFTLSTTSPGDVLVLELPDWGTGLAAARLSVADVVFVAALAGYARRLGLRERAAEAAMLLGLLGAAAAEVLFDTDLPALALICAGYLLANIDRFGPLFAQASEG